MLNGFHIIIEKQPFLLPLFHFFCILSFASITNLPMHFSAQA